MQVQSYLSRLKQAVGVDINQQIVSTDSLTQYMIDAVRAYSRYRPLQRNYGEGSLATDAAAGSSTLVYVGSPVTPGTVLTLDAYGPFAEAVTVASISRIPQDLYTGVPVQITTSAPTNAFHPAGATIGSSNMGLTLVAGQQQYVMPGDWISPEQETWSMAIGARSYVKQFERFYDGVYGFSEPMSGVDIGMAQNFLGGLGPSLGGYLGLPGTPPNQVNLPNCGPAVYKFAESTPVILTWTPAPQISATLNFFYWATQLPETVPDKDFDLCIIMGQWRCMLDRASQAGTNLQFAQGTVREDWASTAAACTKAADKLKEQWEQGLARWPLAISG